MSSWMIVFVAIFLCFVFWQFGARLSARYAITWWLGAIFLLFCTIFPAALGPVAHFFGIELISNLVIAGLLLFLFFQTIDLTSDLSKNGRILRKLISEDAATSRPSQTNLSNLAKNHSLAILPCYNEEASLKPTIKSLFLNLGENTGLDFQIIDDGSDDESGRILSELAPLNHLSHKANIGVAGVLLTGFRYAQINNFEYVVQCDSDGQHPIDKLVDLVQKAKHANADLLIGSRFLTGAGSALDATTLARLCGIFLLRLALRLFGKRARVTDPTSGLRVYSRAAVAVLLRNMPDEYPEPESIAILAQAKLNIVEFPVAMAARSAGVSSLSGLRQIRYFAKVTTALIGLRLRR